MKGIKALATVLVLGIAFWFGGCGGDGDHGPPPDPCVGGPVPCLTEDWGDAEPGATYYIFEDQWMNPVLVFSDGVYAAGAAIVLWKGIPDYWVILVVGGTVLDCYNGQFEEAAADFDWDGIPDYEGPATGTANICKEILTTSGVVIDGYLYPDIRAVYVDWDIIPAAQLGMIPEKELAALKLLRGFIERRKTE